MIVPDDEGIASSLRGPPGRAVFCGCQFVRAHGAGMSDVAAALGLEQLHRIDGILARRKCVERWHFECVKSFEGIKVYLVQFEAHFSRLVATRLSRTCGPTVLRLRRIAGLHWQRCDVDLGFRRGDYAVGEKMTDRAIALQFHAHLDENRNFRCRRTMKDAATDVGAVPRFIDEEKRLA